MVWKPVCVKEKSEFKIGVFDSIDLVNSELWNDANFEENIYLSISYLKAIEETLSSELSFRYLQFYNQKKRSYRYRRCANCFNQRQH